MKQFLISLFIGTFAQIATASYLDMQVVMDSQGGNFHEISLPIGFTTKELLYGSDGTAIIPNISADLKKTLTELEEKEKLNWIDYVTSTPWEFVECSESDLEDEFELAKECYAQFQTELDVIALNPEESIGGAVLELELVHAIYKNDVLVGYVFEYFNQVDATMIQDGSGIVIYLDADMNVLGVDDWQS